LNIGRRVEAGSAIVASILSSAYGGKSTFDDFAPHERGMEIEDEQESEHEYMMRQMAQLGAVMAR